MQNALKNFKKIELDLFNKLKKQFKDDLLLYCVLGGLSRQEIIKDWSDIDILLVFDIKYDLDFWKKLSEFISDIKYPVKIGYTFYSLREFLNKNYKDPKTLHAIHNIKLGIYKPRIKSTKINLDKIDLSKIKIFDNVDFTKYLHEIKRALVLYPNYNEKKILKNVYTLSKIVLRDKNVNTYGYKDTSKEIRRLNPKFKFFLSPMDIIKNSFNPDARYKFYIDFIKWLEATNYAAI